jgi:hypothetical protein
LTVLPHCAYGPCAFTLFSFVLIIPCINISTERHASMCSAVQKGLSIIGMRKGISIKWDADYDYGDFPEGS